MNEPNYPADPETCVHPQFDVRAHVNRHADGEHLPAHGFDLSIAVRCKQCGRPFQFVGVPYNLSSISLSNDETIAQLSVLPR